MNFSNYARDNYTNRGEFPIPRGFADSTKLNTVDGETQDYSYVSPLRAEFYTEVTLLAGAAIDAIAGINFENTHDSSPALVFAGATAVMGIAAAVRHRAQSAVRNIL